MGHFLTIDPAKDGHNWYNYCMDNPVKFVDPSGMMAAPFAKLLEEYSGEIAKLIEEYGPTIVQQIINDIGNRLTSALSEIQLATVSAEYCVGLQAVEENYAHNS